MPKLARLLLVVALAAPAAAQEAEAPAMSPEDLEVMRAWMALAQPGEHHEHLARLAGSWEGEVEMWMSSGAEPMLDTAQTEATLILGGRFLAWTHTGTFQGSPFEGIAFDAYNNGDERYETVWMDNFGTLILFYQGDCSDDGTTRTLTASFSDPVSGGTIENRVVYSVEDDDHFTYESYMREGGEEFRNLRIRWTRQ